MKNIYKDKIKIQEIEKEKDIHYKKVSPDKKSKTLTFKSKHVSYE